MRVVYLSPVPWESFAQRPHKFVDWAHRRTGESILWIDPYPTRFPTLGDLARRKLQDSREGSNREASWITVLRPGGIPIEPLPGSSLLNARIWSHCFKAIEAFSRSSRVLIVIGKPSALALETLERFKNCASLYDAMDDFPAFYSGFSRAALSNREGRIAMKVDEIWTSSTALKNRWAQVNRNVTLVHNALDSRLIPRAPRNSRESGPRVFGYVGTMGAWFDWEWVTSLAAARPTDEIRLIGPVFVPPRKRLPQNVTFLPACDHRAALNSMLEFDVGLIPFKATTLTESVDPIKYYEYRGVSLPVLSTCFGEMRTRDKYTGVFISRSLNDLELLSLQALEMDNPVELAEEFISQNSWDRRFDDAGLSLWL